MLRPPVGRQSERSAGRLVHDRVGKTGIGVSVRQLLIFGDDFVYDVIEDALACLIAFSAADVAVDVFAAQVDDFGFHAVFL